MPNLNNILNCCIAASLLWLSGQSLPAEGALVRLKGTAVAGSAVVALGDIAEVRDDDEANAGRLREAILAPAPAPGRSLRLELAAIRSRLGALGHNLTDLEFTGQSVVTVTASGGDGEPRRLSSERKYLPPKTSDSQRKLVETAVAAAVCEALEHRHPELGKLSVTVSVRQAQLPLLLSAGADAFEIEGGRPPFEEPQLFEVRFKDRDGKRQSVQVKCDVVLVPRILTLSHSVPKGHVIRVEDLAWKQADRTAIEGPRLENPAAVVGMQTTRAGRAGEPLSPDVVCQVPLIRSGEIVTVYSRRGGIVVRMEAKARSSGAFGETVTLSTLDGREKLQARVAGLHEAEVLSAELPPVKTAPSSPIKFLPGSGENAP